MEQVIAKNTQDPEKSKFGYGNEKMKEEQNSKIEPTETTNDIRRVTANTPALFNDTPPLF
jgi:hypothetical protein